VLTANCSTPWRQRQCLSILLCFTPGFYKFFQSHTHTRYPSDHLSWVPHLLLFIIFLVLARAVADNPSVLKFTKNCVVASYHMVTQTNAANHPQVMDGPFACNDHVRQLSWHGWKAFYQPASQQAIQHSEDGMAAADADAWLAVTLSWVPADSEKFL